LKVIDDRTLAFADSRGNRQYITTGNLQSDDRVAMILVDYPRQARLKILGRVEIFEGGTAERWLERILHERRVRCDRVQATGYKAVVERVFMIHVEAFDWNCPQHITPRYTEAEIRERVREMERRVENLEQENKALREESAKALTT
jgi:predicted pyridoxine 5'-phosphate oxidase superfamily flavin-nucleotide-binding protein